MAGQPAPNDLSLAWVRHDLLKAPGNKEYVPFTVTIDPSKVVGRQRLGLLARRREGRSRRRAAAPASDDKKATPSRRRRRVYAYEDLNTADGDREGRAGPTISRSFTVPPAPTTCTWS